MQFLTSRRTLDRRLAGGAIALVVVLTVVSLAFEFTAERSDDVAHHRPPAAVPSRDDTGELLAPASNLVSGNPPTASDLAYYPASTFVEYVPLALLPGPAAAAVGRVAILVFLVVLVRAWGRREDGHRSPWLYILLLSTPAVNVLRLDQFNTALGLALLWAAATAQRRSDRGWLLSGFLQGLALSRPFSTVPAAAAYLVAGGGARVRRLTLTAVGGLLWVIPSLLVAWRWDRNVVSDSLATGGSRAIIGLAGFARTELGTPGVVTVLMMTALACVDVVIRRARNGLTADVVAAVLALSILPVHLGGPYVAVYALPALARLTAKTGSKWWSLGPSLASVCLLVGVDAITAGWPNSSAANAAIGILVFSPLLLAPVGLLLFDR